MPEDGIAIYGMGGTTRSRRWDDVRMKELNRLKCRARKLLQKTKVARLKGDGARHNQLLAEAHDCLRPSAGASTHLGPR